LLPVSGSVKARGGFHEVLVLAEKLTVEHGLLKPSDDYSAFDSPEVASLLSQYTVMLTSTGNLGLSVGTLSRAFGFRTIIHMSHDAKSWKKERLRSSGATVIEHAGDYSTAMTLARSEAANTPRCHFVDDENSLDLLFGYAPAAFRLKEQLVASGITPDEAHPLFVYLPCGVGGSPAGIMLGLKLVFGSAVKCFFAEPCTVPSVTLGVVSGLNDAITVQDIGLTGRTMADGLACSRPSRFVGRMLGDMIDGFYTLTEEHIAWLVRELYSSDGIFIEPSAATSLGGYTRLQRDRHLVQDVHPEDITHLAWSTGGGMVPQDERDNLLKP